MCPRVFRAPEGPAAREARQPRFARRRASKPALALRSLRRPSHQWGRVADVWLGASPRSPARPCHRPPAPRQIPPAPFTPAALGVLTCGSVRRLVVRPGPAAAHRHRGRSLRRPPHQWCQVADVAQCVGLLFGQALSPPTGTAAWPWTLGGAACVAVILGRSATRCYKRRQSDGFFAENQGFWTQIDDVCNMSTRKEVQTAPV